MIPRQNPAVAMQHQSKGIPKLGECFYIYPKYSWKAKLWYRVSQKIRLRFCNHYGGAVALSVSALYSRKDFRLEFEIFFESDDQWLLIYGSGKAK